MTPAGNKRLLALIVTLGLLVGWWYAMPRYVVRFFRIPTGAMKPALPIGSYVLVHPTKAVHVSDITVFRYPLNPKFTYVMRVVANGGDTVEIRDKVLFVNGRARDEPYVVHEDPVVYPPQPALPEPYRSRDQFGPFRVPPDSWFVLGDNRDRSSDSRYWGTVPSENVIGRVIYVIK
jgi:signal peptidase I